MMGFRCVCVDERVRGVCMMGFRCVCVDACV